MSIAKNAYVLDQYHSDTFLDDSLCDHYYVEWIKNCCHGLADKVMVAEIQGKGVVGYISLNIGEDSATVGLAAVDERYRGLGCFTFLIGKTLHMLRIGGKNKLYYGTQLSNDPVLKTMGKFNGYVEYSNHVMHLMIKK